MDSSLANFFQKVQKKKKKDDLYTWQQAENSNSGLYVHIKQQYY